METIRKAIYLLLTVIVIGIMLPSIVTATIGSINTMSGGVEIIIAVLVPLILIVWAVTSGQSEETVYA